MGGYVPEEEKPKAAPAAPVDLGPPADFVPLEACERSVSMTWVADYFRGRGVLEQARAVGAGGCARWTYRRKDGSPFVVDEGRVVVPFRAERHGPWVGYSARLVRPRAARPGFTARDGVKYLYPRGMDRRTALWGREHLPPIEALPRAVVVVEGVFDALPLYPLGVATLGSAVTDEQVAGLAAIGRPIWVALDGDAWRTGRALAARLEMHGARDVGWCRLPAGEDPGTLGWRVLEYGQPGDQ